MKKICLLPLCLLYAILCGAQAIVPVKDEPRHHKVFENAWLRVLDVRVPPGDTTGFHRHQTPSVFIVLHPVKTGSQVLMEAQQATALSGDASISFEGFYTTPRVHRVWNEDTSLFHVMDVELLHTTYNNTQATMQCDGCTLLFEEQPVRGYRLTLPAAGNLQLHRQSPLLVVGLATADTPVQVNNQLFTGEGDYLFVPAGKPVQLRNRGSSTYSFALLELR